MPPTPPVRRRTRPVRAVAAAATLTLALGVGAAASHDAPAPAVRAVTAASVVVPPVAGSVASTLADAAARALPEAAPSAPAPTARATKAPAAPRPKVAHAKVARWLPTGTGMWLHEWQRSEQGHAPVVVKRAQAAGLTHLYVQTGSSRKGWIGDEVLGQLLPATKGTQLRVIAWDFPKLVDPVADARRMARAALYRKAGAPRVAAVAPDVETGSEGTHLSARGIDLYYSTLRRLLPPHIAILPTVPWPSEHRITSYPYERTARFADAIVPMAYWYNRDPARVTATSMRVLTRYGKPVMPVGQGYDGRLDAPYLAPDPHPDASVQAFLTTAKEMGARSVSLWSWQTTGAKQWRVLARAGQAKAFLPGGTVPSPAPTVPWTTRGKKK
ncbi:MAG: hypothetical protein Q8R60_07285 [Mycobacteriales bacterium]|nr:hypothetical protein [Mycobacteriales bacterium]